MTMILTLMTCLMMYKAKTWQNLRVMRVDESGDIDPDDILAEVNGTAESDNVDEDDIDALLASSVDDYLTLAKSRKCFFFANRRRRGR